MACSSITESRFSSTLISRPGLSQQEKLTKKGGHGEQFKDQIQAAIACDLKRWWSVAEEFPTPWQPPTTLWRVAVSKAPTRRFREFY